jgi:uncharacterized membrane protein
MWLNFYLFFIYFLTAISIAMGTKSQSFLKFNIHQTNSYIISQRR